MEDEITENTVVDGRKLFKNIATFINQPYIVVFFQRGNDLTMWYLLRLQLVMLLVIIKIAFS